MWPRCDERGINPTYELDVYICQLQFGRTHLSAESRCLQTLKFQRPSARFAGARRSQRHRGYDGRFTLRPQRIDRGRRNAPRRYKWGQE